MKTNPNQSPEVITSKKNWVVVKFRKSGKLIVMRGGKFNADIYEIMYESDDLKACEKMKKELMPDALTFFDVNQYNVPYDGPVCRTCEHMLSVQKGNSVFKYCSIRSSGRTDNGLLKIKTNMPACILYKPAEKK